MENENYVNVKRWYNNTVLGFFLAVIAYVFSIVIMKIFSTNDLQGLLVVLIPQIILMCLALITKSMKTFYGVFWAVFIFIFYLIYLMYAWASHYY